MGLSDLSSERANDSLLNNPVMAQRADHNYENGNRPRRTCINWDIGASYLPKLPHVPACITRVQFTLTPITLMLVCYVGHQ